MLLSWAAAIRPQARALLPVMLRYVPGVELGLGHVELRGDRFDRFAVVVAGLQSAAVLASAISGFLPNLSSM